MTVCVGVISEDQNVILLSDRMLTAGNVQFSPPRSKIVRITNSIAAAISGDVALASELLDSVRRTVSQRIASEPDDWWYVRDVAQLWRDTFIRRQALEAEIRLLSPLGLTIDSFVEKQKFLSVDLVEKLSTELIHFQLPSIDLIFAGIDHDGAHLYSANGSSLRSHDAIGFATVGSGSYHASSHLMFAGHTRATPTYTALYNSYVAKKRAEIAPGVGPDTDTWIAWALGQSNTINTDVMDCLERTYSDVRSKVQEIERASEQELHAELNRVLVGTDEQAQEASDADGAASVISEGSGQGDK